MDMRSPLYISLCVRLTHPFVLLREDPRGTSANKLTVNRFDNIDNRESLSQ